MTQLKLDVTRVLGVDVAAVDMNGALQGVRNLLRNRDKSYICVGGVHGVMEAQRSPDVALAYAHAAFTIPDGMPLVWVGHAQGHPRMQRVTGPDFMIEIFRRKEFRQLKHFLYGGDVGVAQHLRSVLTAQFPWARIVAADTPPFRKLTHEEEIRFIQRAHALRPDIIWVGISCPRQELFMRRYLPLLDTRLMVGVGAAFDYHTGRIRDSADWVKKAGLQWLHRLVQDPRRLWKRYLLNNPAFVCRIACQLIADRVNSPISDSGDQSAAAESKTRLNSSASASL